MCVGGGGDGEEGGVEGGVYWFTSALLYICPSTGPSVHLSFHKPLFFVKDFSSIIRARIFKLGRVCTHDYNYHVARALKLGE